MRSRAGRLALDLRFAVAVGPRRILRRAAMALQRRKLLRHALLRTAGWSSRAAVPAPLLPPKKGMHRPGHGLGLLVLLGTEFSLGAEVDWSAAAPSGSRVLWHMTLHYMEYIEELDDVSFEGLIRQWIDRVGTVPHGRFPEAWNPYTVALRTVVWMRQLSLRRGGLEASFIDRVESSIADQLHFLSRFLETDVGGNHLIKNIKALIWGCTYFGGTAADRWRQTALQLLRAEIHRQLLPDGIHFERSISYHCQVFADLLEVRHLLGPDGTPPDLDRWLNLAAQAVADLSHPDGAVSLFGDSGLHMATSPSDCLACYEQVYRIRPSPQPSFSYPVGGYFGYRSSRIYFVIDCGPVCPAELPAHGQGDILSFELSVDGHRMIVDQGVFEYVEGDKRDQSRSAGYHNTLCPERGDQAQFFGSFRSVSQAAGQVSAFRADADGLLLEGRHHGFAMQTPGPSPSHSRTAQVVGAGLTVSDMIVPNGWSGTARSSLLLAPGARIQHAGEGELLIGYDFGRCRLRANLPVDVVAAKWWPDMGTEIETRRLVFTLPPGMTVLRYSLEVL